MNDLEEILKESSISLYPKSINHINDSIVAVVNRDNDNYLIVFGNHFNFHGQEITINNTKLFLSPLIHENANELRRLFEFTAPQPVLRNKRSFGVGDRLGIATLGHIDVFNKYDASPILAQQSIRELNLTERTYEDVLDAVTFAVFKEGFKRGFGADGDHLKKEEDIKYALSLGFSMITLDCSEYIKTPLNNYDNIDISQYHDYLKEFTIEDQKVRFDEKSLKACVYIYKDAINFIIYIYNKYIKENLDKLDFEVSIDETMTPTTPCEHFFVANELAKMNIKVTTIAPRFCGEFQKGIDYIGDINQFEKELKIHAAIARHFNYKLSIHSGSDKFKTFKLIGKYTNGNFHVKTAGTNWLEAVKIVAMVDYELYREIHKYALKRFNDATKFYHVTTNLNNIPDVDKVANEKLVDLLNNDDCRQLLHINYGFILTDKDEFGNYVFKDKLYKLWKENENLYRKALFTHIGHHLELLYNGFEEE